jgi:hypothetical protein
MSWYFPNGDTPEAPPSTLVSSSERGISTTYGKNGPRGASMARLAKVAI